MKVDHRVPGFFGRRFRNRFCRHRRGGNQAAGIDRRFHVRDCRRAVRKLQTLQRLFHEYGPRHHLVPNPCQLDELGWILAEPGFICARNGLVFRHPCLPGGVLVRVVRL